MDINFSDSFHKSIKRLIWHESPIYKTYKFFRSDLPGFFKTIWLFRKALWNFAWWDYRYSLEMFQTSLKIMAPRFEKYGLEVDESRLAKVQKMRRAIDLMQNFMDDNFIEQAEKEVGEVIHYPWEFEEVEDKPGFSRLVDKETEEEKEHNRKVFKRADEIEEHQWQELWDIMRGTERSSMRRYMAKVGKEEARTKDWNTEVYDGTDLRGWWD